MGGSYSALRVMPFSCWAADNACYPPDDDPIVVLVVGAPVAFALRKRLSNV